MFGNYIGANNCFKETIKEINNHGNIVSPRNIVTKELIAPKIMIYFPRNRVVCFEDRKTDIFYALGEFFWYLSGSNSLDFIKYYASSIVKYSDDGQTLNSAYGYNIWNRWFDQWERCKDILKKDNYSRHAIIFIRGPEDLLKNTKDSVCTNTVHFLIRDNKLNMIVNMRSNDFCVGFVFDVFCFTMLQELMSIELNVELGEYHHVASSMHIYENWFNKAESIANSDPVFSGKMNKMNFINNIEDEILDILKYEQMIRTEPINIVKTIKEELFTTLNISSYWIEILQILCFKRFLAEKNINECEDVISFLKESNNELFVFLLKEKLKKWDK